MCTKVKSQDQGPLAADEQDFRSVMTVYHLHLWQHKHTPLRASFSSPLRQKLSGCHSSSLF